MGVGRAPATQAVEFVQVWIFPQAGQLIGIGTRGSVANSTQSVLTPVDTDAPVCGHLIKMAGIGM